MLFCSFFFYSRFCSNIGQTKFIYSFIKVKFGVHERPPCMRSHLSCAFGASWTTLSEYLIPIGRLFQHDSKRYSLCYQYQKVKSLIQLTSTTDGRRGDDPDALQQQWQQHLICHGDGLHLTASIWPTLSGSLPSSYNTPVHIFSLSHIWK